MQKPQNNNIIQLNIAVFTYLHEFGQKKYVLRLTHCLGIRQTLRQST